MGSEKYCPDCGRHLPVAAFTRDKRAEMEDGERDSDHGAKLRAIGSPIKGTRHNDRA